MVAGICREEPPMSPSGFPAQKPPTCKCGGCRIATNALTEILRHARDATDKKATKLTKHDAYYAIICAAESALGMGGHVPQPYGPTKATECFCGKPGAALDFYDDGHGPIAYLVLCPTHKEAAREWLLTGSGPRIAEDKPATTTLEAFA